MTGWFVVAVYDREGKFVEAYDTTSGKLCGEIAASNGYVSMVSSNFQTMGEATRFRDAILAQHGQNYLENISRDLALIASSPQGGE
jgi:hypothetical protein